MYNVYTKDNDGEHLIAEGVDYMTAERYRSQCQNIHCKDAQGADMPKETLTPYDEHKRLVGDFQAAIMCLHDIYHCTGGYFPSSETDFMFQQRFCDFNESTSDAIKRLIKETK